MYEIIETISLTKEFKDFWGRVKARALDKLNLKVYRGEIFGLLGPNGSGKTTTVKLLLGLLFPTSGKIKILGKSPRHVANKTHIGFLPEESYLYKYQNAEEALFFYGRLFGLSKANCRKRVEDLLEMVGLTKARKRPLKEYSKGMARRIGIAQALINDPELIFLDEPTTGLDPIGTREIKDLILMLKKHGKTVFLCSHLLADVEDICDRLAILYGGKIRSQGTVPELLSQQNVTQISINEIDENLLSDVLTPLRNKGLSVCVDHPRERLESFFLKVIEDARSKKIKTSGAEAGKSLEDFFTSASTQPTKQNEIINSLLDHKPAVPKAQEQKVIMSKKENGQIIEQLTQASNEEQAAKQNNVQTTENEENQENKNDILHKLLSPGAKEKQ